MLGFRGYRLSVLHPEITEMQVKAIIAAELDDHVMPAVRLYRLDAADNTFRRRLGFLAAVVIQ